MLGRFRVDQRLVRIERIRHWCNAFISARTGLGISLLFALVWVADCWWPQSC